MLTYYPQFRQKLSQMKINSVPPNFVEHQKLSTNTTMDFCTFYERVSKIKII